MLGINFQRCGPEVGFEEIALISAKPVCGPQGEVLTGYRVASTLLTYRVLIRFGQRCAVLRELSLGRLLPIREKAESLVRSNVVVGHHVRIGQRSAAFLGDCEVSFLAAT